MNIENEDKALLEVSIKVASSFIGEEGVTISRTIQEETVTWPQIVMAMYDALRGMGYRFHEDAEKMFETLADETVDWEAEKNPNKKVGKKS